MSTETNPSPVLGFEEIAEALYPGAPVISPDGRYVAFEVRSRSKAGDHPESAIWLSRDGKPATRFTGGKANNSEPVWSPDSTRLAFLANRDDPKQMAIHILPVDGGEAQRLGDLEGALAHLTWSPDGTSLAVERTDSPTDAEKAKTESKDDPIVFEEDDKLGRIWIVDATTGKSRQLTTANRHVIDYGWHRDGQSLVYVTTPIATINARFVEAKLWQIPVRGGLSRHIADFSPAPGSPVVRTLNGEDVVVLEASVLRDDPSPSAWAVPLAGGEPSNLLPGYEGVVYAIDPDPASKDRVIVKGVEGTSGVWFSLSAAGGDRTPITLPGIEGGSLTSSVSVAANGAYAGVWSKSDHYGEVWLATGDAPATALTSFGDAFADRLNPGEIVRWTARDGVEIEGILVTPRDHDASAPLPLFVQIHGGPSWQWDDKLNMTWHDWAQMLASRGWAVLLPNPRGSTGRGSAFEKLLFSDVGGGESTDLVDGAQAMVERGIADPERLAIGGWSWGGYLTAWTITQTDIFKAAVMGAGVANLVSDHAAGDIAEANMAYYPGHPYTHWDLYADRSPVREAAKVTTPTLILHGDADSRVHPTQGQEFHRALQVQGVPVRFVKYPREGHSLHERKHQIDLMQRIVAWLEQYVPAS